MEYVDDHRTDYEDLLITNWQKQLEIPVVHLIRLQHYVHEELLNISSLLLF